MLYPWTHEYLREEKPSWRELLLQQSEEAWELNRSDQQHVLEKLRRLHLPKGLVASALRTSERKAKSWLEGESYPAPATSIRDEYARRGLHLISLLLGHMENDLALSDKEIRSFIKEEPVKTREERGLELSVNWSQGYERACNSALFSYIHDVRFRDVHDQVNHGFDNILSRLERRYPERYDCLSETGGPYLQQEPKRYSYIYQAQCERFANIRGLLDW